MASVLIIEDDQAIRSGIADALDMHGHEVMEAANGEAGLDRALGSGVDLVLLDIMMPKMNGMDVIVELRQAKPGLPVIFLTALGEEADRVRGLRAGADDYVVKPFSISELLARVEAVLRRSPERPSGLCALTIADRRIDFDRREARLPDGRVVGLSQRETDVLAYLSANRGRAVSRDELLSRVWGVDPRGVQTRTVDMAMARIREQLEDNPAEPRIIATVRGKGYMLAGNGS